MRYEWQQILWSVGGGVLGEIGCQCLNNVEIIEKGPAFFICSLLLITRCVIEFLGQMEFA